MFFFPYNFTDNFQNLNQILCLLANAWNLDKSNDIVVW